jgi:two-component system phosphate regulon sensor histidine kinase PhoR
MRIRTKLTLLLLLFSVLALGAAGVFTSISVGHYLRTRIISELRTEATQVEFQIRNILPADSGAYESLRAFARAGNYRLTLIAGEGTVIFESEVRQAELGSLENHATRPEIVEALRGRTGTSTRHSATVDQDLLYLARPVIPPIDPSRPFSGAAAIRLSIPLTQVTEAVTEIRTNIVVVGAFVFGIVLVAVGFLSTKLSAPLAEMSEVAVHVRAGELDRRIDVRSKDEIGRLGDSLNAMIDTLNQDIARLRKLERVRTEFLGNVSHELRTPIFAIQGMLETLLDGAIDDREVNRDFLRSALNNTRNLNALLSDLIEISRIESGDMKMSYRFFDAGEFLRAVAAEMAPLGERRGIRIAADTAGATKPVYGDRDRLKQVLVNLIENAVKYNREGGGVRVASSAEGDFVRIAVEDDGVGISPDHVDRIFERFYRVDKERSRDAGGTGLGLAIVKHIVEAHGSAVRVQSVPGTGSTFSFLLRTTEEFAHRGPVPAGGPPPVKDS